MMMLDENKLKGLHTSSEHFDEKYGKKRHTYTRGF